MRAIAYHSYGTPDVLGLEDIATPTPASNEVRVQIRAAAVTAADSAFRRGNPWFARLFTGISRPKNPVLGTEFAGVIDAVGADVTEFRVGDQVFAASGDLLGAHAEYICLPADGALAHKPQGASFEEAASICEGALTALPFLRDTGQIRAGQQVLINGASGSVGSSAVQLAKHFGAEVTGVCSATNLDLVRSLGADHVIDYTAADFTTDGKTYDIILDAVGKRSFGRCRRALKPGGVYLRTVPTLSMLVLVPWTKLFGRKKARISFTGLRAAADKAKDLRFVRSLVEEGALKPVIDTCYRMEQAGEAHALVDSGHKRGSAVLSVG
jgi:NADPH:quinone reductase-like Zn-dependent oxidoreductase